MARHAQSILDLEPHMNKAVRVKCVGGREFTGVLKGFDKLLNLVLDDAVELMRDPEDTDCTTSASRPLGIMVCRGPSVMAVAPNDGYDAIANPFEDAEEDEEEGDAE
ncbi:hypothetical protein FNF27_03669 [Cafeteria roenbergensis]|uniref:Sm domain-containing protein n=1 Tax=Cafeteria roenbergensis TaxID=33653 RepID=A0A5A8DKS9_CAFRO|nr:hypothetical protein FNF29_04017 [Cafeteria roenbergensis]KAA0159049.1 hypothetical protein FNF27_08337 [Cafeteria roenbergensis]KAA0165972.1 hypothetical protein FNF31_01586 [Cafeteria roenbergensis]KAA0169854.1 hypothetical protein FNF28_01792 [Cafeteria roenbergensis]KAA0174772.1 hypothetical protein FNF27_03669 [Cafeteria roenbergensis]|eukprot:KAA0152149.1 hypothetical protein FNF29_04017 [Cafeteria roenbergensis]